MKNNLAANKKSGQAMLIAVIFFLALSTTIVLGIATPILRYVKTTTEIISSKKSYYLAAGALDDTIYRIKNSKQVSSSETLTYGDGSVTTIYASVLDGNSLTSTAEVKNAVRKIQADIIRGTGISFHYGVQAGNGGFSLANSSSVIGNIFSSGSVIGSGNMIYGDIVSAGSTGLVDGVHATGTVFSHTIRKSTSNPTIIDKDAYYVTKTGAVVINGTEYPNSPDQPAAPLPISDAQIAEWETQAAAGGTISTCDGSGNYVISSNTTIGPKKIACNLVVRGTGTTVTIAGPIWVSGNISTQNSPILKMSPDLGDVNVAIIADNPTNRSTSSKIELQTQTNFQGSGSSDSFVFMISQNNSAENGGNETAISLTQGTGALIVYAAHGEILLAQSVSVKEVTAYKISLSQSATVKYDTGLPSVLFSSGPVGGYEITGWREVE